MSGSRMVSTLTTRLVAVWTLQRRCSPSQKDDSKFLGMVVRSSSSTGYATPGGVAEANLQPKCPGFLAGMVRRSPDRCTEGPYSPSDFTPSGAPFLSRENGRSGAEERLACRDVTLPYPVI